MISRTQRVSFRARRAVLLLSALAVAAPHVATADVRPQPTKGTAWCGDRCDELVIDWNAFAFQVFKAGNGLADPLGASRALAMMHLAMHDAANAAKPRFAPYAGVAGNVAADSAVAAVAAAHDVLATLFPDQKALIGAQLDKSLFDAGGEPGTASGVALGKQAAAAVLQKRSNDGTAVKTPYQEGSKAGEYRFTPGFSFAALPQWRNVQPFALATPGQFRSAPPPALTSPAYAADFNEVKLVGGKGPATRRTRDETLYAAFWYEFSEIGWNRITRVVARNHRQDLWERARTFALVNVAMADAYIAGWDSKYHYNLWRPITAIRMADADGNPSTAPDAAFEPLLVTPPVQDYPSTHSALGAAAAHVLAESFGSDRVRFTFTSTSADPANPVRTFRSFSEAARENADSRVKAGLHFRFATTAGLKLGEEIGRHVVRHSLKPVD